MNLCLLLDELLMSWNSTRGDNSPETAQRRMKARSAVEAYVSAAEKERDEAKSKMEAGWIQLCDSGIQAFAEENAKLTKERDEALAYAEKLKEALDEIGVRNQTHYWSPFITQTIREAFAVQSPAALSHLRQEIRMEALGDAAMEASTWATGEEASNAIRRLAEEAKEQERAE